MADPSDFLTIKQAAGVIGVSTRRVYQLIAQGLIQPAARYGATTVVPRADVERLAREGWPGRRKGPAARDRP